MPGAHTWWAATTVKLVACFLPSVSTLYHQHVVFAEWISFSTTDYVFFPRILVVQIRLGCVYTLILWVCMSPNWPSIDNEFKQAYHAHLKDVSSVYLKSTLKFSVLLAHANSGTWLLFAGIPFWNKRIKCQKSVPHEPEMPSYHFELQLICWLLCKEL